MNTFILLTEDGTFLSVHSSIIKAEQEAKELGIPEKTYVKEYRVNETTPVSMWDWNSERKCFVCSSYNP